MNQLCNLCNLKESCFFNFINKNYYCNNCFKHSNVNTNNVFYQGRHDIEMNNKCEPVYLENCNQNFERYQWLNEFSKGASGIIYQVYNKILNKKTLLKVQLFRHGIIKPNQKLMNLEILISCLVSELPNFVKIYNYWICDIEPVDEIWKTSEGRETIEELWDKSFQQDYDPDKDEFINIDKMIFYIEMEQYEGTLRDLYDNKTISDYDKFSFFFELTYSIMNAYKQFGFKHGDIHARNIFYMFNSEKREYNIDVQKDIFNKKTKILNIICQSVFVPIWGDFGYSKIKETKEKNIADDLIFMLQYWNFSDQLDTRGIKNNKELLEWLGEKVINYQSIKKKKIK